MITFDPSANETIKFRCNRNGSKKFIFLLASDSTAWDLSTKNFQAFVKVKPQSANHLIDLTASVGGIGNNELTLSITNLQSDVDPFDYYFELYESVSKKTWISAVARFVNGPDDQVDDTDETISVVLDGDDVVISVAESGGSGLATVTTDTVTIIGDGSVGTPLIAVTISDADLIPAGDYTFVLGDAYPRPKTKVTSSAVPFNMIIPADIFSPGQFFYVLWEAAGQPTFTGPGVTMHSPSGSFIMSSQYSISGVYCVSANQFRIVNGVLGSGSVAWGAITGTLSAQTDLVKFVNSRALILGS